MRAPEDNIRIGIAGMPHAGKDQLTKAATEQYASTMKQIVEGNFWVPDSVVSRKEERSKELFAKYSADPEGYAFRYQVNCLANRLKCQQTADKDSGIVLQAEPPEVERATYGEANRRFMGEDFSIYENMAGAVIGRTKPVHFLVYLQVKEEGLPVILDRITRYGREGEKKFLKDPSYLLNHIQLHEDYMKNCRTRVITIDATHPAFGKDYVDPDQHLKGVLEHIVQEVRTYKPVRQLPLWEWEAIDYNSAQDAARVGRRQLRKLMGELKPCISTAGLVSIGKSGLAAMVADSLDIELSRELSGKNNVIVDKELLLFLDALAKYNTGKITWEEVSRPCYDLQVHLRHERPARRKMFMEEKNGIFKPKEAFIEDRSDEEDREIFWKLFHDVHHTLSDGQYKNLLQLADEVAKTTIKPDLYLCLTRSALEAKKMSVGRGRDVEQEAWSLKDMRYMEALYPTFFASLEPRVELNAKEFDSDKEIHRGWLWQEMMIPLLKQKEQRKTQR